MNINSHLLGDHLKQMGIITDQQLEEVLQIQRKFVESEASESDLSPVELVSKTREMGSGVPMLGQLLLEKGYISQDILEPVLAMQNQQVWELRKLSSEKLALVIQIGFIINSTHNLMDVLSLIMKYSNIVTNTQASSLMLLDEKTGELVFSVPTGPSADELTDIRIPKGAGVAGWVVENQQYALIQDVKKDSRFYSKIDDKTGSRTKSLLCVPLRTKHKIIGVLEVINKNDDGLLTEDDALLLNLFSQQAAIAIENAILFNAAQRVNP